MMEEGGLGLDACACFASLPFFARALRGRLRGLRRLSVFPFVANRTNANTKRGRFSCCVILKSLLLLWRCLSIPVKLVGITGTGSLFDFFFSFVVFGNEYERPLRLLLWPSWLCCCHHCHIFLVMLDASRSFVALVEERSSIGLEDFDGFPLANN